MQGLLRDDATGSAADVGSDVRVTSAEFVYEAQYLLYHIPTAHCAIKAESVGPSPYICLSSSKFHKVFS
jgi:hypothetical protein